MLTEQRSAAIMGDKRRTLFPGVCAWANVDGYPWWPARIVRRDTVAPDVRRNLPADGADTRVVELFITGKVAVVSLRSLDDFVRMLHLADAQVPAHLRHDLHRAVDAAHRFIRERGTVSQHAALVTALAQPARDRPAPPPAPFTRDPRARPHSPHFHPMQPARALARSPAPSPRSPAPSPRSPVPPAARDRPPRFAPTARDVPAKLASSPPRIASAAAAADARARPAGMQPVRAAAAPSAAVPPAGAVTPRDSGCGADEEATPVVKRRRADGDGDTTPVKPELPPRDAAGWGARLCAEVRAAGAVLRDLAPQLRAMEERLAAQKDMDDARARRVAALRAEEEALGRSVQLLRESVAQEERVERHYRESVERLRKTVEELAAKRTQLEEAVGELERRRVDASRDVEEMAESFDDIRAMRRKMQEVVQGLDAQKRTRVEENRQMVERNRKAREEYERVKGKLDQIQKENDVEVAAKDAAAV